MPMTAEDQKAFDEAKAAAAQKAEAAYKSKKYPRCHYAAGISVYNLRQN